MREYYKVHIVMTARKISPKEERYQAFDEEVKEFDTMKEVERWLKEQYNGHRKMKMYQDPDGKHIGWIYCFKNRDWSHASNYRWQQDWVSVYSIQSTPVLVM